MTNIDCGWGNFKTPRELELEEIIKDLHYELAHLKIGDTNIPLLFGKSFEEIAKILSQYGKFKQSEARIKELEESIKTIFSTLIIANHKDVGTIQDTIWVDKFTTLWDYIGIVLDMNNEQFEEFEKQALQRWRNKTNE